MNHHKIFEEMTDDLKELMQLIQAYVPSDQRVRFMLLLNKIVQDAQELGDESD
jgi:hypothetical protein